MNKQERVIEIADKNGFDWFGKLGRKVTFEKMDGVRVITLPYTIKTVRGDQHCRNVFSYSELATNKSFLEAIIKGKNLTMSDQKFDLQKNLINDLTDNNGDKFWDICLEFTGENQ